MSDLRGRQTSTPITEREYRPVRRIVTGEDDQGRSVIVSDGPTPNVAFPTFSSGAGQVVWATGAGVAPGDDPAPAGHRFAFHSDGGSLLRIADFAPDEQIDSAKLAKFLAENRVLGEKPGRHAWFHKTLSLDYAIVLEGEIYAMMDVGETLMRAGDVLIQRATSHSWSNRSGRMCRMAFVLLALPERETK
ncbi:cupin domain-containing protein [Bradyrhizobium sp. 61]|uniref:cupin domain-containing protein n=1 Tax=unclassified Bradyrhizobium TaxID=2631580 RepID=UPI001FFB533D|nr:MULTISPECIES: cupin domain-containing protein [unclassified Bradyrhizobium]MCK1277430.1 cupin domain-containing protein [Bradyrhizobium sp. 61]MCK1447406.1 cupin domain-containing protein [Bradyrhizobium sp. 48]MCK1465627.1 cupin domain-containing protein [Bradyrhizobium sp. 2]